MLVPIQIGAKICMLPEVSSHAKRICSNPPGPTYTGSAFGTAPQTQKKTLYTISQSAAPKQLEGRFEA